MFLACYANMLKSYILTCDALLNKKQWITGTCHALKLCQSS